MPPKKGKKKGGKKSSKKNGKKKKNDKIPLTPKEEILKYQIDLKDELLNGLKFKLSRIEDDNQKMKSKLEKNKDERELFIEEMLKQYREMNKFKKINPSDKFKKSDVIDAMKENWKIEKQEKDDIIKLESQICGKNEKIKLLENEMKKLIFLRDEEIKSNNDKIDAYKSFIEDMKGNFAALCNFTKKNYETKINDIKTQEKLSVDNLEKNARLKVSKLINDDAKHEISDNQWLKNKAELHRENLERLKLEIEHLQTVNIQLNRQLFEINQTNPHFQSFYLTDIDPNDILFQNGILEYDIKDLFGTISPRIPKIKVQNESNTINDDEQIQSFKDYLNFNSLKFGELSLTGIQMPIEERPPKSNIEQMADTHTIEEFVMTRETLDKLLSNHV